MLFSFEYLSISKDFPRSRPVGQKWIMHIIESPWKSTYVDFSRFDNLFNVTLTYHTKSDIVANYSHGYFRRRSMGEQIEWLKHHKASNYASGKKRPVAAFISNCHAHSNRVQYIKHLKRYIAVDIYGRCGSLTCRRNISRECYYMLNRTYKFYLSFENMICQEYVTEKLWNVIKPEDMYVIPIVMGGANYSKILPPNSYIDIADFDTPKDLAKYMTLIDKNDTLFNSFFSWKEKYVFQKADTETCQLCEYLNKFKDKVSVYPIFETFWNLKKDCSKPWKYYNNIEKYFWV